MTRLMSKGSQFELSAFCLGITQYAVHDLRGGGHRVHDVEEPAPVSSLRDRQTSIVECRQHLELVYIAGGIAEKIEGFLMRSPFRQRFEDKGRLTPYVAAIPTQLIANPDIALLGAARSGIMLAPAASS